MVTVEASRFVRATPAEVERALDPTSVVEYEGTYSVVDVEDGDDGEWLVTARARRLETRLRFEERPDGYEYEQVSGPLAAMWTEVAVEPENEGARVTARSTVDLGLPLAALTDRVAAWKRRGELERALAALAADVE